MISNLRIVLNNYLPLLYIFIALLFCSFPYLVHGYPFGHDSVHELIRVKEYQIALTNHQIPAYWAENLYGGYGSPIFIFYAPFYLFISTIFYYLTGTVTSGCISAMFFFTSIAAIAIYFLVLEILNKKTLVNQCAARISIYFFILNPYLIGDKFIRIASAEYTALCLAPISLYGLVKIRHTPVKGVLILAAGLALVILAHNLTSLIITGIIISLSIILYWDNASKQIWLSIFSGIILALLLAAFFWLPALWYKSLTHTEELIQGRFDFHNNFPNLDRLFFNIDFFSMGLLNLWGIIQCTSMLWSKQVKLPALTKKLANIFLIFVLLFIFLQTKLSVFFWENIPYLPLFQFPWRMMGPLALVSSVLVGMLFPLYYKKNHYKSFYKLELILLLLCVINTTPWLLKATLGLGISYPNPIINELTLRFETNNIKSMVFKSTVSDEYLPKTAQIKLQHGVNENSSLILSNPVDAKVTVVKETGIEIILEVDALKPVQLELKRWFFPGWECTINNTAQQVGMSHKGLVAIQIPAGHSKVQIKLNPPLLRQVFNWVSLTALIIWFIFMIWGESIFAKLCSWHLKNNQPL